jgi:hypothetical protein
MAGAALSILMLVWLFVAVAAAALYFLPTIIAVAQHRSNAALVAVVNVLLGWSLIGWVVALVMALTKDAQPIQVVHVDQQMGYMPAGDQHPPHQGRAPGSNIRPVDAGAHSRFPTEPD